MPYAPLSKLLHWLIAGVVLSMLSLGFFMSSLPADIQPSVYTLHKSFGLTVLALMMLRIAAISYYGRPNSPASFAWWKKVLARTIQSCLYALLLIMPLSGWVMSTASGRAPHYFGLFSLPMPGIAVNDVLSNQADLMHCVLAWVLLVIVSLHLTVSLPVVKRMK